MEFTVPTLIGIWVAAFLTLCIFSFLYHDNPLYKFAEHLFVGVSAGYWMSTYYWQSIRRDMVDKIAEGDWISIVPGILGVLLILRLFPKIGWISRWPLAFLVGISAGFNIVYTMQAQILKQIDATILPLWSGPFWNGAMGAATWSDAMVNWIIVLGVFCALIYFYFSVEHRGPFFGVGSRIGIYILMISFGASFGYTVMARVSLLIGRMLFFKNEFWPAVQRTFGMG